MQTKLRLRFTLRSVLLIFVLVSVVMAIVGARFDHLRRQQVAVKVFGKIGVMVSYSGNAGEIEGVYFNPRIRGTVSSLLYEAELDFRHNIDDRIMLQYRDDLWALRDARGFYFEKTSIGDETVRLLTELPSVVCLDLTGTKITNASIADLKRLDELEYLSVRDTLLSQEAIAQLRKNLPECNILE
jgi:hypothetical protein